MADVTTEKEPNVNSDVDNKIQEKGTSFVAEKQDLITKNGNETTENITEEPLLGIRNEKPQNMSRISLENETKTADLKSEFTIVSNDINFEKDQQSTEQIIMNTNKNIICVKNEEKEHKTDSLESAPPLATESIKNCIKDSIVEGSIVCKEFDEKQASIHETTEVLINTDAVSNKISIEKDHNLSIDNDNNSEQLISNLPISEENCEEHYKDHLLTVALINLESASNENFIEKDKKNAEQEITNIDNFLISEENQELSTESIPAMENIQTVPNQICIEKGDYTEQRLDQDILDIGNSSISMRNDKKQLNQEISLESMKSLETVSKEISIEKVDNLQENIEQEFIIENSFISMENNKKQPKQDISSKLVTKLENQTNDTCTKGDDNIDQSVISAVKISFSKETPKNKPNNDGLLTEENISNDICIEKDIHFKENMEMNPSFDEKTNISEEINKKQPNNDISTVSITLPTNLENSSNLAKSTLSLNDNYQYESQVSKTHSHSVENIAETKIENGDKILADFKTNKIKASAHQLLLNENQKPKEYLPQDIGNIVKNVHGIFSSVSGSIKNAYNTQRTPKYIPKTPVKLPTNKILNDIFDDQTELKTELKESTEPVCEATDVSAEALEKVVAEQRREMNVLKERVRQQADEMISKDAMLKDVEVKMEAMRKRLDQAEKEKDTVVMRYASRECVIIEAQKSAERSVAAEKAAVAELELVNGKLKSAHAEKQRICQMYDDKCHELQTSEREVAKLREDLKEMEGRLKWTQSKLRMEMDAYKDSAERIEKLTQQVSELESARDTAATNAADGIKAKQLEQELKECQATLILLRHEKCELDRRLVVTTQALDTCRRDRDESKDALDKASEEVVKLRASNLQLEEEAASLAGLRAEAALASTLATQLEREKERANTAEQQLIQQRALTETCMAREARALEHAAQLTAGHVGDKATMAEEIHKVQALSADNSSLREKLSSLEEENGSLRKSLEEETERRNKENRVLARKVAELTEEVSKVQQQLEWEKGENCVLKKKHASAVKELNRELQRALKRCDQLEQKVPQEGDSSRGSVTSLSSGESSSVEKKMDVPDVQVREPDRQALIERIVSLQRAAARRAERCDFLEEHCRQLTQECRNKAKLLRTLICATAPTDAQKRDIARLGGGAVSSLWGSSNGVEQSHELAIDVNRKLQAVLEDALLNNIMLKENVDTLGKEIARLKSQDASSQSSDSK